MQDAKTIVPLLVALVVALPSSGLAAQGRGQIRDAITGEPVPYANVWFVGRDDGVSADAAGGVDLSGVRRGDSLSVSAVGYDSRIAVSQPNLVVPMTPDTSTLGEAVVRALVNPTSVVIAKLPRRIPNNNMLGSPNPWRQARFFPRDVLPQGPFQLEEVRVVLECKIREARMLLSVRGVSSDGTPGAALHGDPLVITASKGTRAYTVPLAEAIPRVLDQPVFIVLEWLDLPEHMYGVRRRKMKGRGREKVDFLAPSIRFGNSDDPSLGWFAHGDKWVNLGTRYSTPPFDGGWHVIFAELRALSSQR